MLCFFDWTHQINPSMQHNSFLFKSSLSHISWGNLLLNSENRYIQIDLGETIWNVKQRRDIENFKDFTKSLWFFNVKSVYLL